MTRNPSTFSAILSIASAFAIAFGQLSSKADTQNSSDSFAAAFLEDANRPIQVSQLFGTPCDRAPAYRGTYCYNWNARGITAALLDQNYVIIIDVGNGYIRATTPFGNATGTWIGAGNAILKIDNPTFPLLSLNIGCLGRTYSGQKWGFCDFIR
jgi:hypothetical protein